ncbi:MAG TPA: hypothetical protein GXZ82_08235 [Firmicutes bacterium]|nr:hypothetical protein [Bacillota bacterium]
MLKWYRCLRTVVMCLVFVVFTGMRMEAAPASFVVSPLLVTVSGAPGTTQAFGVELINQSMEDIELVYRPVSIIQTLDGRFVEDTGNLQERSAASWVSLSGESVTLQASERYILTGIITIPRNYEGGAYAGIVVHSRSKQVNQDADFAIQIDTEFLVVLQVETTNRVKRLVRIERMRVLGKDAPEVAPFVSMAGPAILRFSTVVNNDGNTYAYAQVTATLRDKAGRKIGEFPLGRGKGLVLPGAGVEFVSYLPSGLPDGEYTMQVVVNYGGSRPAIAKQSFTVGSSVLVDSEFGRTLHVMVEPERLDIEAPAGALRTTVVQVQNLESEPILIQADVLPLVYDLHGNLDFDTAPPESAAQWTELRPQELRILPGQRRNVQVIVRPPVTHTGGGYSLIRISALPEQALEQENNITTTTEEYVAVFALPKQGVQTSVSAEIQSVQPTLLPDNSGLEVAAIITNTGDRPFSTGGRILLYKKVQLEATEGIELLDPERTVLVKEVRFATTEVPVLPNGSRELQAVIYEPMEPGDYIVDVEVNYGVAVPLRQSVSFEIPTIDDVPQAASEE